MLFNKTDDARRRAEPVATERAPQSTLERLSAERKKSLVALIDHRRREQRSDLKMIGEAHIDGKTVSVYVIDGSIGGLRVRLHDDTALPDKFRLRVISLDFDQPVFLAWQRDQEAGVEF